MIHKKKPILYPSIGQQVTELPNKGVNAMVINHTGNAARKYMTLFSPKSSTGSKA